MEKTKTKTLPVGITNNSGYTLIELIVVIVIIGIVLVLSVPVIQDTLLRDQLDKTARYIGNKIVDLRAEAVREQVDCQLHISLTERLIWTATSDMTAEKKEEQKKGGKKIPDGVEIEDVQYINLEKQNAGDAVITIFKKGYLSPVAIHLKEGDRQHTLAIEPFLPDLTIIEKYADIKEAISGLQNPER